LRRFLAGARNRWASCCVAGEIASGT
jgi:hypothetical protein